MTHTVSQIAHRVRICLLFMFIALAACDSDMTPIVPYSGPGSSSLGQPLRPDGATSSADYRLGAGDRMRIIVFGQPNLSGEFALDGKGTLAYPLLGRISAEGLTSAELQRLIAKRLDPEYLNDPSVSIEVAAHRPFYVVGEVLKPGSFPYVTDLTVLNAIATAGGQTYRANMSSFYVKRIQEGRIVRMHATQESILQPGDTVMVRERYF